MPNYTTVQRALGVIAQPLGLTVKHNREELVEKLNTLRSLMYSSYQQNAIAVDREECLQVRDYQLDCDDCKSCYSGITLPYDAAGAESIKLYGSTVTRHGSFKSFNECASCIQAWDMLAPAPTQTEIPPDVAGRLLVMGHKDDVGKFVMVRFRDCTNHDREEKLTICDKNETDLAVSHIDSIALETGRKHKVSLYLRGAEGENDCLLSQYRRSEHVPAYKRIRLNIGKKTCPYRVNAIYARSYLDVYDDDELVETDSIFALREFAAYLALNSRPNNSAQDRQEAMLHLAQAQTAITGSMQRDEGFSMAHTVNIRGGVYRRRPGLAGNRR